MSKTLLIAALLASLGLSACATFDGLKSDFAKAREKAAAFIAPAPAKVEPKTTEASPITETQGVAK